MSHDRSTLRCVVVAVVAGCLLGPLDLAGQVHAPYPFANLFNSPAVWAAAAFVFGVWAKRRRPSVLGAIVMEVVAVVAYYLADVVVRGSDASILVSNRAFLWVLLGVGAGLVFGTAGALADDASNVRRAAGNALLPAVFLAEASHQLIRQSTTDADGRPDDLVGFAILLAILAVVALVWRLHGRATAEVMRTLVMSCAVAAIGGLADAVLTG